MQPGFINFFFFDFFFQIIYKRNNYLKNIPSKKESQQFILFIIQNQAAALWTTRLFLLGIPQSQYFSLFSQQLRLWFRKKKNNNQININNCKTCIFKYGIAFINTHWTLKTNISYITNTKYFLFFFLQNILMSENNENFSSATLFNNYYYYYYDYY